MTSEEIEQYLTCRFSADCPHMVLRQNAESPDRVYEGPGSIYQTPEGELRLKLYSGGGWDIKELRRMLDPNTLKPGEIIPKEQYFSLEATTMHGHVWRTDAVLVRSLR